MERQYQEERLSPMLRPGSEGQGPFLRFVLLFAMYMTALLTSCILLWLCFTFFFNHALFTSIWSGIVEIWNAVKVLASVLAVIGVLWLVSYAVTHILQRIPRRDPITFEETENVIIPGIVGARQYSFQKPPVAERRRVKKAIGTKIELAPPSIQAQFETGLLSVGMLDIMHGFDAKTMEPVRLPSYSSLTVGGTGSGKTRGNVWRMLQRAVIEEKGTFPHVTVCDPHASKPDGIAPLITPAEGYVHIARTPAEIVAAAREFYQELENRKMKRSTSKVVRHIFFDEWAALMDDKVPDYPYTKEDKSLFLAVMKGCVREYRGYGGFGHISMQNPKESNIGDVTLRDDMPLLLIHKVSEATVSFLYISNIEKWKRAEVMKLKKRQCYVDLRTEEFQAVTVMPDVNDDAANEFVSRLQEAGIKPSPVKGKPAARSSSPESETARKLDELIALIHAGVTRSLPAIEGEEGTSTSTYQHNTDELAPKLEAEVEAGAEVDTELRSLMRKFVSGEANKQEVLRAIGITGGRNYKPSREALDELIEIEEGEE